MKYKNVSWDELDAHCLELSKKIRKGIPKHPIHAIVAIAKGGLVPARILAKYLKIDKIYCYGANSYKGEVKGQISVYQPLPRIKEKNILIVDDISDTGQTFENINKSMSVFASDIFRKWFTASIYIRNDTKWVPHFYVESLPAHTWVVFPFEDD